MIPTFSPDLQQEPWVIEIQALYAQLAIDIAAIHAAEAAQRAVDESNRNAVLLKQQQHLDQLEADRLYRARCWLPYQKIIDAEKAKKEQFK